MSKIIMITGSTDGIGLETAKKLLQQGHHILIHGRNLQKIEKLKSELSSFGKVEGYIADLSDINQVQKLAGDISNKHSKLDALINNAGVFKSHDVRTKNGLDVRFAVNTIAPYLLSKLLLPLLSQGRIINLSSAAQASINYDALLGHDLNISHMEAYSQSKLALIMWSFYLSSSLKDKKPAIISINPGSLLATKMVKDGFGVSGKNINIGVNILVKAALSDEFLNESGKYFDNDVGKFTEPHSDALDHKKCRIIVDLLEKIINL